MIGQGKTTFNFIAKMYAYLNILKKNVIYENKY